MKKIIGISLLTVVTILFLISFVELSVTDIVEKKESFTFSIPEFKSNLKEVGKIDKRMQDIIVATSKGLIEIDENSNIIPSLAQSVDIVDDGLEYNFKLKDNIYWSDGSKILPKDILTFFKEIMIEEDEETIEGLLNVYGAKAYRQGDVIFSETVGIYTEENSIIFRLNSKDDNFINELSKIQYRIRKNVLLWDNIKNNYANLIYSGDYSIKEITPEEIGLKSNDKSIKVQNINIIIDEESELAMAGFEIGTRDIVINPPKSQLNRLSDEDKLITNEDDLGVYISYNEKLEIESKKYIHSYILKAVESYELDNSKFIDLAEGSYVRHDKEDLTKLQERKVIANNFNTTVKIDDIYLAAENTSENKEMLDYISNWFLENTDIYLEYYLLNEEDLKVIENNDYYDLILFECNIKGAKEINEYENLIKLLPNSYDEKVKGKSIEELKLLFLSIEEDLYNDFQILPLAFFNNNIATNKYIKNLTFDIYGNINFKEIEKS